MTHFFVNYYYWGMHLIWWFLWICLLIWIFATPYDIPGQRTRKDSPLDILKKRFASGEITKEEYYEQKSILEKD
ncbi:SHOCT domain-containing protein [Mucilaginibacter ximonensis]|uniref:SHOCT domain-containing protein n=1 Tax=Mucilaginibacter ximonensis TaxID=538021 RepID=A0ABW5YCL4_9SPHI